MPPTLIRPPPADGGYPVDADLHQMSDDGGPVGPDPARWSDPDWRDGSGPVTRFVTLDADRAHVRLAAPGADPVVLGPFPNPAVARDTLAAVRAFLAAALATG